MVASRSTRRSHHIDWTAYLYILPAFVILGLFHIFPVFYAIDISLNTGPINKFKFVGLQNYLRALATPDFWTALSNTFSFALMTIVSAIGLGLLFAYLLYQGVRGQSFYRTVYFLPYVLSTVGSSIVWAWVFDPSSGLANLALKTVGVPPLRWLIEPMGVFQLIGRQFNISVPVWMHGPSLALVAIAIFTVWQTVGYNIVIFMAGLTNIPGEIYEAARLDGADSFQLFRFMTFPLLSPTLFFVLVISVIGSFQSFNQIYSMNVAAAQTLGGPLGTTYTMTVYMFDQLYTYSNYGYASAIAVLLSGLILILTLVNFRLVGSRTEAIE
ncbi:MAG TPA: sugar ABC transporter permease [Anaerolineales bacterium]|nr:sugar ABC transporter permease [Anaerolineales bacterium]